jgi:hypothetical protein
MIILRWFILTCLLVGFAAAVAAYAQHHDRALGSVIAGASALAYIVVVMEGRR